MSATEIKTHYRPGLVFRSPFSSYQVVCRPYTPLRTPNGDIYDEVRELLAEFAIHGAEYTYTTPDGFQEVAADIRGHFFDLDVQAEQKDWTDDEREIVARVMLREVGKKPDELQLVTAAKVAAPWPTYDQTHHNQIPTLAETLGLVAEALTYEGQNKNRESVIAKLNEAIAAKTPEDTVADDLIAA